mgnify:CR=1 FL=1
MFWENMRVGAFDEINRQTITGLFMGAWFQKKRKFVTEFILATRRFACLAARRGCVRAYGPVQDPQQSCTRT